MGGRDKKWKRPLSRFLRTNREGDGKNGRGEGLGKNAIHSEENSKWERGKKGGKRTAPNAEVGGGDQSNHVEMNTEALDWKRKKTCLHWGSVKIKFTRMGSYAEKLVVS